MSLNESIIEDAAVGWFGELCYAVGHGPHPAPGEPAAKREPERSGTGTKWRWSKTNSRRPSFSEVVLVGRFREAIRRLNAAIPEEAAATDKESLSVQNTSKGG